MKVAIFTGGPSAERGIAIQSAELVARYLDPRKYDFRMIMVEEDGWYDHQTGVALDMNDCSLSLGNLKIRFDFAFLVVHGTPVEDGKMQGYFEMQGIPHSTCDTLTCALTFNKQWCKDLLRHYNVPMANSIIVESHNLQEFNPSTLQFPVFVKPNNNGSSYGVSRVDDPAGIMEALKSAAEYDTEIMVEEYMPGREFSCGLVDEGEKLHVFPITEIIPEGEFFDYDAKYLGASQEVTPADVEPHLAAQCQERSRDLYKLLRCKGMVRFDYILVGDEFKLLEVNTVPGLSEASIIPQQAQAYGWTIAQLLDVVIQSSVSATSHESAEPIG